MKVWELISQLGELDSSDAEIYIETPDGEFDIAEVDLRSLNNGVIYILTGDERE